VLFSYSHLIIACLMNSKPVYSFYNKACLLLLTGFLLLVGSCSQQEEPKLFEQIASSESGIRFSNNIKPGFDFNILDYNYFYNGGGVCAADFNNDGLTDLYFTGNQVSSKLYLNKGNFVFEDVTEKAGVATKFWATGIAVADVNKDGFQDMYVSYAGYPDPLKRTHQLFIHKGINNGIPLFTDEALAYGLADTSYTTQSAFLDFDKDGDLDLFPSIIFRIKPILITPCPRWPTAILPAMQNCTGTTADALPKFQKLPVYSTKVTGLGLALATSIMMDGRTFM
jgi:hypothetical protein